MIRHKPLIIFILGPTGTGKSEFAVKLAKRIGGEIISCDSMQVYKGMPMLSQQPKTKLRNAAAHHLIGILSSSREWSAAAFIEKASEVAEDIVVCPIEATIHYMTRPAAIRRRTVIFEPGQVIRVSRGR